jgi:hypothetical protein
MRHAAAGPRTSALMSGAHTDGDQTVARNLPFQVLRNQSIQEIGFAEWAEDFVRRLVVATWRLACSLGVGIEELHANVP